MVGHVAVAELDLPARLDGQHVRDEEVVLLVHHDRLFRGLVPRPGGPGDAFEPDDRLLEALGLRLDLDEAGRAIGARPRGRGIGLRAGGRS